MKSKYFVLPLLLATSFLTGCGNSAPKDNTAMELVVTTEKNETISFDHDEKDKISVDWGDGTTNNKNSYTYAKADEYTITIKGTLNSFKYTSVRKESLVSVTIGNVISFSDETFQLCRNLVEVKCLGNAKLKEISKCAFEGCQNLTSVTIPNSVVSIRNSAFGCCSFDSIVIPGNVTFIDDFAFNSCNLKTISFVPSSSLQTIGFFAFSNCAALTSISIPDSVVSIGGSSFENCTSLQTISTNPTSSLQTIGNNAFRGCKNLTSISIPDSVVSIGDEAFENCTSLETVLEENIHYLGNNKNHYLFALSANDTGPYTINEKCKFLNSNIFEDNNNLESISIPSSVTSIGSYAFQNCISLKVVSINPRALLKVIKNSAFSGCTALTSISIPDSVTLIDRHAFSNSGLQNVYTNPTSSLQTIGDYAFFNCTALKTISIPNSVVSIGVDIFKNCTSLEATSKENINYLGNLVNHHLFALSANDTGPYTINEKCKFLNSHIFEDNNNLESISIPGSVTSIGEGAFQNCTNLRTVSINPASTLKQIDAHTFSNCTALTSIVIPNSIALIALYAFHNCSSLSTVDLTNLDHVPFLHNQAFDLCTSLSGIYVRSNMLEAFKTAEGWSEYVDIITDGPFPSSMC